MRVWWIAILACIAACGSGTPADVPAAVARTLESASSFEVLSIHPEPRAMDDAAWTERGFDRLPLFHDYAELGRVAVDADTRERLLSALYRGIAASDGSVAACFNPRHGLVARHGDDTVELLICFECLSMMVWRNGEQLESILTTGAPQPAWNDALRAAGVDLPEQ